MHSASTDRSDVIAVTVWFFIVDPTGEVCLKIIDPGKVLQTYGTEESLFYDLVFEVGQEGHGV